MLYPVDTDGHILDKRGYCLTHNGLDLVRRNTGAKRSPSSRLRAGIRISADAHQKVKS